MFALPLKETPLIVLALANVPAAISSWSNQVNVPSPSVFNTWPSVPSPDIFNSSAPIVPWPILADCPISKQYKSAPLSGASVNVIVEPLTEKAFEGCCNTPSIITSKFCWLGVILTPPTCKVNATLLPLKLEPKSSISM